MHRNFGAHGAARIWCTEEDMVHRGRCACTKDKVQCKEGKTASLPGFRSLVRFFIVKLIKRNECCSVTCQEGTQN